VTPQRLEEYLALPYTVEIYPDDCDEQTCFVARVVELPGCVIQADSIAALSLLIEEAKRAWIEEALLAGRPIPIPESLSELATDEYPQREALGVVLEPQTL
jgi:antitoxin HicB